VVSTQIIASDLERIVYDWLVRRGISFDFQTSFSGGHYQLGGSVVDFLIGNLAWRVQGEYWHRGVEKAGADIIQREMLESLGYTVVDLRADDLENMANETLTKALRGEEMLR